MKFLFTFFILTLLPLQALYAHGGSSDGGGHGVTGQYSEVTVRTLKAIKIVCGVIGNQEQDAQSACSHIAAYEVAVNSEKVEPRSRDTILGLDNQPRDAGNDGYNIIYLDVDRWTDKMNETNSTRAPEMRRQQVKIAVHEPLVLAKIEQNDMYNISDTFLELLSKNYISFDALVGKPESLPKKSKLFNGDDGAAGKDAKADAENNAEKEGYGDCVEEGNGWWSAVSRSFLTGETTYKWTVRMICFKQ